MIEKKFSIDDIQIFRDRDDEDVDFAFAKIYALAVGSNSHKNPISEEVLRRDAHTMLGKFLVAKYDNWTEDVTTHVNSEAIVGYFPKDSKIEFEEKDGKLFVVYEALVSKLYATQVYNLFEQKNFRNVSCEFSCTEGEEDENGEIPITSIFFHGCTILGLKYNPSCAGSEMNIVKFSENEAEAFYKEHSGSKITKFAEERRIKIMDEQKTYKVDKTELKDNEWGDVDKAEIRNKIMDAKNKSTLVKSVYALVEDGWQDAPSEHLKYPLMQLVDDTFYYNRYALSSALAYAKQENETSVITKVEKLYDKFKLGKEDEKQMSEIAEKEFIETGEVEKFEEPADIEETKEKEFEEVKPESDDTEKEFESKDNEEETETDKEEDKEFSLDANVDTAGLLAMLEEETEDYRALAVEMLEEDKDIIMAKTLAMYKELSELKQYKAEKETEIAKMAEEAEEAKKMAEIEKIMEEVKDDLSEKDFAELKEEGMGCKFEQISQFANKVKAFAYEQSKGKEKPEKPAEEIMKFGFDFNAYSNVKKTMSAEDIFNKYK